MKRTTRDRVVLPILLPVGILVVMAVALYGFSRILLAVSHNAATAIALVVALAIVVVAAVVAARRYVRPSSLAGLVGAVTGVAMLAGGVAIASLSTEAEGGEGGGGQAVEIVAVNIAFQQTTVTVPAGEPFQIVFENQDAGIQHNVQIFDNPDFAGTPLFSGELITGVSEITYDVPALEPGSYPFNCLVHPNMVGTIEAVEGGGGGGGGPSVAVAAANIAFDTDTIELPADSASTIVFDNQDAGVQHNISIYADDTMAEPLFQGELITGPASVEYAIPPLPAGEYYFVCDVHPTMNGTVIVGGEGGGSVTTALPSPTATSTSAPAPSGDVAAEVSAQGIAFDTAEIVLPANTPSTIRFVNNDSGIQHNIVIATDESLAQTLFDGEIITGPGQIDYRVPPLEPGTYYFVCIVHPNMNGIVTVE